MNKEFLYWLSRQLEGHDVIYVEGMTVYNIIAVAIDAGDSELKVFSRINTAFNGSYTIELKLNKIKMIEESKRRIIIYGE